MSILSRDHVLWSLGFRPFFILTALFGLLSVPLWLLVYFGKSSLGIWVSGLEYHAHEMLFGFSSALISGFLLTAVRNWTGLTTPRSGKLQLLVLLWLLGRFSLFLPPLLGVFLDLPFLFTLSYIVAGLLLKTANRRNYSLIFSCLSLAFANVLFYLQAVRGSLELGFLDNLPQFSFQQIYWLAIEAISFKIALIGGRIIPLFTRNALQRRGLPAEIKFSRELGRFSLFLIIVVLVLDFTLYSPSFLSEGHQLSFSLSGVLFFLSKLFSLLIGLLALYRLFGWITFPTLKDPLLAILYIAQLWFSASWIAKGLSDFVLTIPHQVTVHLFTSGAIGVFAIAMLTRVAIGHTGRPFVAPFPAPIAYSMINLAALLRVGAPFLPSDSPGFRYLMLGSAIFWSGGFLIYLFQFVPILTSPRVDGKPE